MVLQPANLKLVNRGFQHTRVLSPVTVYSYGIGLNYVLEFDHVSGPSHFGSFLDRRIQMLGSREVHRVGGK